MSQIPDDLKYADSHEWVRLDEDNIATVGITDHAQELLGDLVFIELPTKGAKIAQGEEAGVVESVKAASDIYAPVSGKIIAVNDELVDSPELVNSDPYGDGWLYRVLLEDESELDDMMDSDRYSACLEEE